MAEIFRLKEFAIRHTDSVVKVGTDGLILGAVSSLFAHQNGAKRILDIGTGTGIVALMLASRLECGVTALEIDPQSVQEAEHNVRQVPFGKRIAVHHCDYLEYHSDHPYDLIVSNPPYYPPVAAADRSRMALAKHIGRLTPNALFGRVEEDLAHNGYLLLILPTDATAYFEQNGRPHGLQLHGVLYVQTVVGKAPKRAVHFWHRRIPADCFVDTLTILERDGTYTEQYRRLMQPYLFI